jgi:hypothetical protein
MSQGPLRAALIASELLGLARAHFVIRLEALESEDTETIVAWFAPALQRLLTAPLLGKGG